MDNILLSSWAAADIDAQVDKVLRGLGSPEPPLDLALVRALLELDKGFYSAVDTSWVQEKVSRLRVAGKQILERPSILLDVIKKFDLKALYLPDRRRILLDEDLPQKKHRWNEAHEIGHSLIPWHEDMMLGDDQTTLTPECHAQVEAEANFAAGHLLFMGEKFVTLARDIDPSLDAVRHLSSTFGNTLTTTLWRYVEQVFPDRAVVGLVSVHPGRFIVGSTEKPCRYYIGSAMFQRQFGHVGAGELFQVLSSYCGMQKGGPLGSAELLLGDVDGQVHRFHFETFYNRYDALSLGLHLGPYVRPVSVS